MLGELARRLTISPSGIGQRRRRCARVSDHGGGATILLSPIWIVRGTIIVPARISVGMLRRAHAVRGRHTYMGCSGMCRHLALDRSFIALRSIAHERWGRRYRSALRSPSVIPNISPARLHGRQRLARVLGRITQRLSQGTNLSELTKDASHPRPSARPDCVSTSLITLVLRETLTMQQVPVEHIVVNLAIALDNFGE